MSLIKTINNLHEDAPHTRLTNAESAGTNAFRVENTTALTDDWAIQVGKTGEEQTEVLIGSATAIGSIDTTANSNFAHPADTPVYFIKYDQVVFERSTDGTAGTATPMTNGTITYQPDSQYTVFDDTSGSSTYGYRTYFRSSGLSTNSTESDWITFSGHSFYSLAKIRSRSKNKLWDTSYLNDEMIDEWTNELKDEYANAVIQVNEDYSMGTARIGFGTDGLGTITDADFVSPRRVWVSYDGFSNTYRSTKMNINDYLPDEQFSTTHPYHAFVNNNVLQFKPEGTGSAEITFYRFGTTMVNDTDELPVPMRPFTKSFVDYVKLNAQFKDGKATQQDIDNFLFIEKTKFVNHIVPRDLTGPTMIDTVESVSGEDGMMY